MVSRVSKIKTGYLAYVPSIVFFLDLSIYLRNSIAYQQFTLCSVHKYSTYIYYMYSVTIYKLI